MNKLIPWRRKRRENVPAETEGTFGDLYRRINDLLTEFAGGETGISRAGKSFGEMTALMPTFDVAETDSAMEVRAELPGLEERDIEVLLDDNILTIRGEKRQEHSEKKRNYHLSECRYGRFERILPLAASVERDKIEARFKKGVLRIIIPKSADARANRRRISVSGE